MKDDIKEQLQKIFKGDIDDSEETLIKYSHDASIFDIRPKVVVFPKDSNDVQALVKWVAENKSKYEGLSITARCAGTDMSGGAVGESIIMDFTRYMNKLINFDTRAMSIAVEPGMFYRDFEKITKDEGLILPCFTASKSINAMGGMFGNNSAGERTLKYGKTEDYILESRVVFSDGVERIIKPFPVSEILKKEEINKKIYQLIKKNEEVPETMGYIGSFKDYQGILGVDGNYSHHFVLYFWLLANPYLLHILYLNHYYLWDLWGNLQYHLSKVLKLLKKPHLLETILAL